MSSSSPNLIIFFKNNKMLEMYFLLCTDLFSALTEFFGLCVCIETNSIKPFYNISAFVTIVKHFSFNW